MKTAQIMEILTANGIKCEEKFKYLKEEGYASDACQKLSEELVEKIEEYTRYGINNGFSGDMKGVIEELVKTAVSMGDLKADKKLEKTKKETGKTLNFADGLLKENKYMSIIGEVKKYTETCIKGAGEMQRVDLTNSRNVILQEGINKFAELDKILEDVVDDSSVKAAFYANDIINKIVLWRNEVSIHMHNTTTNSYIDEAIKLASEWKELKAAVVSGGLFKKSNRAKEEQIRKYERDDFAFIAESSEVLGKIHIFEENLKEYKDSIINGRYGTEEEEANVASMEADIKALREQKQQAVAKFKQGLISEDDCYDECVDIDEKISDISKDLEVNRAQIQKYKRAKRAYSKVIKKLEYLNKTILGFKNDPIMLCILGGAIDYDKVTRVMQGRANDEEIAYVIELNLYNLKLERRIQDKLNSFLDSMEKIEEQFEESYAIDDKIENRKQSEAAKAREEKKNKYMQELLKNSEPKEQVAATNDENTLGGIINDDH